MLVRKAKGQLPALRSTAASSRPELTATSADAAVEGYTCEQPADHAAPEPRV